MYNALHHYRPSPLGDSASLLLRAGAVPEISPWWVLVSFFSAFFQFHCVNQTKCDLPSKYLKFNNLSYRKSFWKFSQGDFWEALVFVIFLSSTIATEFSTNKFSGKALPSLLSGAWCSWNSRAAIRYLRFYWIMFKITRRIWRILLWNLMCPMDCV